MACPAPPEGVSVTTIGVPSPITDMADELRYTVSNVTVFPFTCYNPMIGKLTNLFRNTNLTIEFVPTTQFITCYITDSITTIRTHVAAFFN